MMHLFLLATVAIITVKMYFTHFHSSSCQENRDQTFVTSSRWEQERESQVKNGKNSDGSGWLQRGGEVNPQKLDVLSYN